MHATYVILPMVVIVTNRGPQRFSPVQGTLHAVECHLRRVVDEHGLRSRELSMKLVRYGKVS